MADILIYMACTSAVGWFAYQMGYNTGYEKGYIRGLAMQIMGTKLKDNNDN